MGLIFLVVILGAAALHALKTKARTSQRWVELFLVYLLVGYCGLFVFGVSIFGLVDGEQLAKTSGFSTGGPFMQFLRFLGFICNLRFVFCHYTLKATPGQKVAAVGYPFTDELKLTVGRFVQPVANYLLFDVKLEAGNSGGPLIDEKGRMIGLSTFKTEALEDEGYALNMKLVASVVEGWLQRLLLKKKWKLEKGRAVASGIYVYRAAKVFQN